MNQQDLVEKRQLSVFSFDPELSPTVYGLAAEEAFSFLEQFTLEIMPVLWPKETTRLQAQIFNLVFAGQMSGTSYTVSDLGKILCQPRSTAQYAADRLIDRDKLMALQDETDGRRRLLMVSNNMMEEIATLETLLVRLLFLWHKRIDGIIELTEDQQHDERKLEILKEAFRKRLSNILSVNSFIPRSRPLH